MARILQSAHRGVSKAAAKIDETVATNDQLARGAVGLQRSSDMQSSPFLTVNFVSEATVQSFMREIQPLLCVVDTVKQFAPEHARTGG